MNTAPDFLTQGKCVYTDPGQDVFLMPDGTIILVDPFFPDGIDLDEAPQEMVAGFVRSIIEALPFAPLIHPDCGVVA